MKVLTKEEIEIAFQSNDIIEGYKQYQCIELIQNRTETLGFLVMAKRISDGKLVGMSHRELDKPLFFELRKDCNRFIKLIKEQIKDKKQNTLKQKDCKHDFVFITTVGDSHCHKCDSWLGVD